MKEILEYLTNPKENGKRLVINGKDYGAKVEFSEEELSKMITNLSKYELAKTINAVSTVCEQWSSMRVAPNNDIGAVARFQVCRDLINNINK